MKNCCKTDGPRISWQGIQPKNTSLQLARSVKNDEFYTRLSDIEAELSCYQEHFCGKIIYCNCDNPKSSQFWQYFKLHFMELRLKRLIATYYDPAKAVYAATCEMEGTQLKESRVRLVQNGDFRSGECVKLLEGADIVVTNPPFSLWREYIAQLTIYQKSFIIIGPINALTYKDVFPLLRANRLWLGNTQVKSFLTPESEVKRFGNIFWYTNLDFPKRHKPLALRCAYDPALYPKYENYEAIEVGRVTDIPYDYSGEMGVPISFLTRHCPDQFMLLGLSSTAATHVPANLPKHLRGGVRFYLKDQNGNYRRLYDRLVIQRRPEAG